MVQFESLCGKIQLEKYLHYSPKKTSIMILILPLFLIVFTAEVSATVQRKKT